MLAEAVSSPGGAAASGADELENRRVAAAAYLTMGDPLGSVTMLEVVGPSLQSSPDGLLDLANAYEALGDDDAAGNAYVTVYVGWVKKVAPDGTVTTIAGNGTEGYNGDNQVATSAWFRSPDGIAVDGSGALYIADLNNNRIREVLAAYTVVAVTPLPPPAPTLDPGSDSGVAGENRMPVPRPRASSASPGSITVSRSPPTAWTTGIAP